MEIKTKKLGEKEIVWLSEDDYRKAVFQFQGQVMNVLRPLELYGQKPIVDEAIVQIVKLAEDFGLRVRGVEKEFVASARSF